MTPYAEYLFSVGMAQVEADEFDINQPKRVQKGE